MMYNNKAELKYVKKLKILFTGDFDNSFESFYWLFIKFTLGKKFISKLSLKNF